MSQTIHITIPGIAGTIILMLVLRLGSVFKHRSGKNRSFVQLGNV